VVTGAPPAGITPAGSPLWNQPPELLREFVLHGDLKGRAYDAGLVF
jgi:hypothetical protein